MAVAWWPSLPRATGPDDRLSNLPLELRTRIYRYLFEHSYLRLASGTNNNLVALLHDVEHPLSIFRVCQLIYEEVRPFFWQNVTVVCIALRPLGWLVALETQYRQRIRWLDLQNESMLGNPLVGQVLPKLKEVSLGHFYRCWRHPPAIDISPTLFWTLNGQGRPQLDRFVSFAKPEYLKKQHTDTIIVLQNPHRGFNVQCNVCILARSTIRTGSGMNGASYQVQLHVSKELPRIRHGPDIDNDSAYDSTGIQTKS